jgi:hypothetical protein
MIIAQSSRLISSRILKSHPDKKSIPNLMIVIKTTKRRKETKIKTIKTMGRLTRMR